MANIIVTKNKSYFEKIGNYNYCLIENVVLPNIVAFDSETTDLFFLKADMFCFQIGTGENNYLIDLQDYNTMFDNNLSYTFNDVKHILDNKELVFHNANFDLTFLYKNNYYPEKVWDTFLASKILHNGEHASIRHDFGSVMEREINVVYDKSEQKNIYKTRISTQKSIQYCFNDVDKLLELHDNLTSKLKNYGSFEAYVSNCEFVKALAYMEVCGMPISVSKWSNKMQIDILNSKKAQNSIVEYIYDNLPKYRENQLSLFDTSKKIKVLLSSPKQVIPVFNSMNINTKDADGKDSIQEDVINKSDHEFVKMWLSYKEAEHRVTTFGQSILDRVINNRVYSRFNPIVDTNRISSRKGEINFLNFPSDKYTRECFEANSGNLMVVADFAGQETVTTANWTGDEAMIKSILEKSCLHCAFARVIFPEISDLSDEEIKTKHKDKRNFAKAPRFAFQYGGNAFTIHSKQNIPYIKAVEIEKAFKELHAGIYNFGDKKLAQALSLGYVESCEGFKLKLPFYDKYLDYNKQIKNFSENDWELYKAGKKEYLKLKEAKENKTEYSIENIFAYDFYKENKSFISEFFKLKSGYLRLCLNNPSQAKGAFQTKRAVAKLFDYIKQNNHQGLVKICNAPYDEIVLEVRKDLVDEYVEKLAYFMRKEGDYYLTNPLLSMEADAFACSNWHSAKSQ
jgi:DNA polymerase I-like protein with 3'-5' exonuclease and polymerase domains